jgi:hypothetical protein
MLQFAAKNKEQTKEMSHEEGKGRKLFPFAIFARFFVA